MYLPPTCWVCVINNKIIKIEKQFFFGNSSNANPLLQERNKMLWVWPLGENRIFIIERWAKGERPKVERMTLFAFISFCVFSRRSFRRSHGKPCHFNVTHFKQKYWFGMYPLGTIQTSIGHWACVQSVWQDV